MEHGAVVATGLVPTCASSPACLGAGFAPALRAGFGLALVTDLK